MYGSNAFLRFFKIIVESSRLNFIYLFNTTQQLLVQSLALSMEKEEYENLRQMLSPPSELIGWLVLSN